MKIKNLIEQEILVCDVCQKEIDSSGRICLNCGAEHCLFHTYEFGVFYSGLINPVFISSGYYCKPCDAALRDAQSDKLHNFYQVLARKIDVLKAMEDDLINLRDEYAMIISQRRDDTATNK